MPLLAVNLGNGAYGSIDLMDFEENINRSPIGTWEYTVEDVPYEYSSGVLVITKEKGEYAVVVNVNSNKITASDVMVKDDTVNFSIYIEGGKVQVSLQVKDDIINGRANSVDGSFLLKGKRNKS
jgi:hypothetical protein